MFKRIITRISLSVVLAGSLFVLLPSAQAFAADRCVSADASFFQLIPAWHKYLDIDPGTCELSSFTFPGDIWKIGIALVEIVLRVAGMVAFGTVVYAGFKFVMSRGNPSEAAKARQSIIDAVIGVAIASVATVLVSFLGRTLS
jgi:Type IV secretion system pilin